MNAKSIQRLILNTESSNKSNKSKNANGSKARRTSAYEKSQIARERRKQQKVRYDTERRSDEPDAADEQMENMHFANFLGTVETEVFYNDSDSFFGEVNIKMCDKLRPDSSPDMNIGETDIIDNYNTYDFYRGKK
jgi:hypothetical protein